MFVVGRLFWEAGCGCWTVVPCQGCTALHYAASKGQLEVCHVLLEHPRFTAPCFFFLDSLLEGSSQDL